MSMLESIQPAGVTAPSRAVADRAIDLGQLDRIGQNDQKTIREILATFDLEIDMLVARMGSEDPRTAASRAHTLAVAARAVGAWRLADAASEFESAAVGPGAHSLAPALHGVSRAATEVQKEIDDLLSPRKFGQPPPGTRARRVW